MVNQSSSLRRRDAVKIPFVAFMHNILETRTQAVSLPCLFENTHVRLTVHNLGRLKRNSIWHDRYFSMSERGTVLPLRGPFKHDVLYYSVQIRTCSYVVQARRHLLVPDQQVQNLVPTTLQEVPSTLPTSNRRRCRVVGKILIEGSKVYIFVHTNMHGLRQVRMICTHAMPPQAARRISWILRYKNPL